METGPPPPRAAAVKGAASRVTPGGVALGAALETALAGAAPAWRLETFLGRLAEVSSGAAAAALTLVFRLVLEAQRRREPVAWVTPRESAFFPPDAAEVGVDIGALAVVFVPEARLAARAADLLLRSGGFGLVVLDLGRDARVPVPVQSRLAALARKHRAAVLFLTERSSELPSLGPLVSLRIEAVRVERRGRRFGCAARVLKDKGGRPGWQHVEVFRGPDGLC